MRGSFVNTFIQEFVAKASQVGWYTALANYSLQQLKFQDTDGNSITLTWNADVNEYNVTIS